MAKFRVVRQFGAGLTPSEARAYRVESTELLTEAEAFKLLSELGSPYEGRKYEDSPPPEPKPTLRNHHIQLSRRNHNA